MYLLIRDHDHRQFCVRPRECEKVCTLRMLSYRLAGWFITHKKMMNFDRQASGPSHAPPRQASQEDNDTCELEGKHNCSPGSRCLSLMLSEELPPSYFMRQFISTHSLALNRE
ncbi:hypothetical protein EI42_04328 [Thermosporothrix hazakensis]|uniref:Uncharacterized protein n=1 Tax=Thermosporothrix hazakensis TaxID=644383 RepID=A0A326U2T2_THEHA|nr:hypothetical protein EI42_04328 [Thermosporothrix hazakensis]GCE50508.1 hypothetical protein KTH_53770 [Thermosporothrix hazakensis]